MPLASRGRSGGCGRTDLLAPVINWILCVVPGCQETVFLLLSATEPALVTADRPHGGVPGEAGRQRVQEETKSFPVQAAWRFPLVNLRYLWGPCPLGLELYSENPGPISSQGRCRVLSRT